MDIKTILLVILILAVIGGVIFAGIKIMTAPSNIIDETEIIQEETTSKKTNTENTISNSVDNQISNTIENNLVENSILTENDTSNTVQNQTNTSQISSGLTFSNEELTTIYGTGLAVTNINPKTDFPEGTFSSISFTLPGNAIASFYTPSTWKRNETKLYDPISGANVECFAQKTGEIMDEMYNETTYEDVINAFIESEKSKATNPDIEFTTRTLNTDGGNFTVIVKNDGFATTSYIIFIKGLYEYHLTFSTSADDYNENTINLINNIFSSYKIV